MYALRQYIGRFERNRSLTCGFFVAGEAGEAGEAAEAAVVAVVDVVVVLVVVTVLGTVPPSPPPPASSSSLTLTVEEEEGIEKRGFSSIDGRFEFDPLELVALSDLCDWIKEARNYWRRLGETSILIGRAIIGIPFVSRNLQIISYKEKQTFSHPHECSRLTLFKDKIPALLFCLNRYLSFPETWNGRFHL